jgi:hypothetical protein
VIPPEHKGALYHRFVSDGFEIVVTTMTFGKARLCYGQVGDAGYQDAFCYEDPARAIEAAKVWDGESDPLDGWHRNPITGRRRPGGDPKKETVGW